MNLYTSQIASDAIWDKISEHFDDILMFSNMYIANIIIIPNFKISGEGILWLGGKIAPPLYETLLMGYLANIYVNVYNCLNFHSEVALYFSIPTST